MEIREQEKSRARNLIWNAARDYGFEPKFKVYDLDGKAVYIILWVPSEKIMGLRRLMHCFSLFTDAKMKISMNN